MEVFAKVTVLLQWCKKGGGLVLVCQVAQCIDIKEEIKSTLENSHHGAACLLVPRNEAIAAMFAVWNMALQGALCHPRFLHQLVHMDTSSPHRDREACRSLLLPIS